MARRLLDMPLARWAAAATAAGSITFSIDRWRVFILSRGHARLRWVQELTLWSGHVLLAISLVLLGVLGIVVMAVIGFGLFWLLGRSKKATAEKQGVEQESA